MLDLWKSWNEVKKICKDKTVIFYGRSEDWIPKTVPKLDFVKKKSIIDRNPAYHGKTFMGLQVHPPKKLNALNKSDLYIVITAGPYESVADDLIAMGFEAGTHFCVTPEIRDWGLLREIREYDRDVLIACSDYSERSEKRSSKLGGGLYILNTGRNSLEKKVSGHFREMVRVDDLLYIVEYVEKKVYVVSRDFKVLEKLDIDQSGKNEETPNACGIAHYPKNDWLIVANAGMDTLNIYQRKGFKFLRRVEFSDIYVRTGNGQHHMNDICVHGDSLYASFFSFSGNWKSGMMDGGVCQFDLENPDRPPKQMVRDLWMPHSVKFFDGQICYLDSMRGDFYIGNQNPAGRFPGFMRGLAFDSRFYFIGQSEDMYMSRRFGVSKNIMCNAGVYLFDVSTKVSRFYSFPDMMNIHDLLI